MEFVNPYRTIGELNPVERHKLDRHPLDVAEAVRTTYAREGPSAIDAVPGEAERLKWVGLYPQVQGGDAFMLRIKVPGGRLIAAQARRIGEIARERAVGPVHDPVFGDGITDITTRQTIQLHWVHIADVAGIWADLEEVGLTTIQACGDSARNVLGCPVAGVDATEAFDATPVAEAISAYFTGNREYANLPRKWKISATGCVDDCAQAEINDIGLWPARRDDGTLGFNLLVGGGLSDGARMATDVDVFVERDDAVEVTRAIGQTFGELGNRENRGLARMRYLVQELGPERFRAEVANRCEVPLGPAGEALTRRYRGDHVGVHAQHRHPNDATGTSYVGLNVTVGRMRGDELIEAARLAEAYGSGSIRLATDQNLVLTDIADDRLDELLAEPLLEAHSPFPGPFQRGAVACTGSEFCRYAIVETKARAARWARDLDQRLGAATEAPEDAIRTHFSGCSASCAQPQIADVGFRGEVAHRPDGSLVEGVDVGLGGSLGPDAAFIDWVEGALDCDRVPETMLNLVGTFRAEHNDGERFHEWARRVPNGRLRSLIGESPVVIGNGGGASSGGGS